MANEATTLISIESLINSHDAKLSEIKKERTVNKEMLQNILENDEEYMKLTEQINKLNKLRKIAKQKVLRSESAKSIVEKEKDIRSQAKELKTALSDYLSQYVVLSGTNQFEGLDGVTRTIISSSKLVKLN